MITTKDPRFKIGFLIFALSVFLVWRSWVHWSEWTKVPPDLKKMVPPGSEPVSQREILETLDDFHDDVMEVYRMVQESTEEK